MGSTFSTRISNLFSLSSSRYVHSTILTDTTETSISLPTVRISTIIREHHQTMPKTSPASPVDSAVPSFKPTVPHIMTVSYSATQPMVQATVIVDASSTITSTQTNTYSQVTTSGVTDDTDSRANSMPSQWSTTTSAGASRGGKTATWKTGNIAPKYKMYWF